MKVPAKEIILLITALLLPPLVAMSQWTWLNPNITINKLNDVAFVDSLKGYIAGDNGTLLKTTNGGADWNITDIDTTPDLTCIFKVNPSVIYIGGEHGLIMKSMNGGEYWRFQDSGYPLRINSIWFTSVDTGYAVGPVGAILKTTDGAETWSSGSLGQWTEFYSVCFVTTDTGFIAGRSGKIYKTSNGGKSWHLCPTGTEQILYSLFFTDSQTGYASGEWSILKTTDGGLSWSDKNSESRPWDHYRVFFINHDTGFIANTSGSMLRTLDEGATWTGQGLCEGSLYSVNFIDPLRGFAVGNYGIIQSTADCGESWNCSTTFYSGDFRDACFLNHDTGFIAAYYSDVFKTFDGGETWIDISLPDGMYDAYPELVFINPDTGFIPGSNGKLLKTTDGGITWNYIYTGFNEDYTYYAMNFPSADTAYLLGDQHLLRSVDGAETWEEVLVEQSLGLYMNFINNNTGIVQAGATVFHTKDAGETWSQFDQAPYGTACYLNSDTGYVIAQYGFLYKTVDGGFSWENIYHFDIEPDRIIFPDASTGYACGVYGMLYKTIDAGYHWTIINTGTQNTFSFLCFPDTTTGYAGGEGGMLLKYTSPLPVTINESKKIEDQVSVFPNPFRDRFRIFFHQDKTGDATIEVFDLNGRTIYQTVTGILSDGSHSIQLSIIDWPPGIYILVVSNTEKKIATKIVKGIDF